jgi:hypothetical protein
MTFLRQQVVNTDNPTGDAFGRFRVAAPLTIFDSKQIFDNGPLYWDDQQTSGGGTTSSHSANTASTTLGVSASTAGVRVRQTFQRFNYQPGKSTSILMTFVLDNTGGGTDIVRRVGFFDTNNGIFLQDNAGTISLVRRTYVTGSPADNATAQSSWNVDKLDGTGVSGITLDFSKTQILVIDFEWLGVGRVRIGFNIDGITHYCHEMLHANVLSDVYMSTPNLPLRLEITNAGTGVASTLKAICCSVTTEGGLSSLGMVRYASTNGTHVDADVADTVYAVLGIRLKSAYIGQTITILRAALLCETADNFEWFLVLNPTVASTFTYVAETNSAVEIARGATANTVSGGTKIDGGFVNQIGSSGGGASTAITSDLRLGSSIAGVVDAIVLCVRPLGASADIQGSITWQEVS